MEMLPVVQRWNDQSAVRWEITEPSERAKPVVPGRRQPQRGAVNERERRRQPAMSVPLLPWLPGNGMTPCLAETHMVRF